MVLWCSYFSKTQAPDTVDARGKVIPGGSLQFYPNADPEIIFGERAIVDANFGNKNGACSPTSSTTARFDPGSKSWVISFKVCDSSPCLYESRDYCVDPNDATSVQKKDIFYPSQFGYCWGKTEYNNVDIKIDTRTLSTALAVNMGLVSINNLEEVSKDDELEQFKRTLVLMNAISQSDADNLRAFYDPINIPVVPMYCMIYPNTLAVQSNVFGLSDDDHPSSTTVVTDDQAAAAGSPTPSPIQQLFYTVEYYLAFGLVFTPFNVNDLFNTTCIAYYYDPVSNQPCDEVKYLNESVKSYLGPYKAMYSFGLFGIEAVTVYSRRKLNVERNLGWNTHTEPVSSPTAQPTPASYVNGTQFDIYFKYTFDKPDDVLSTIDSMLETMYGNMYNPPLPTNSLFKGAKINPQYFSFIGYFDVSSVESTDDYVSTSNYYFYSPPTPETAVKHGQQMLRNNDHSTSKLRNELQSRASSTAVEKFLSLNLPSSSRVSDKLKGRGSGKRRDLSSASGKAKVSKTTGASCYIRYHRHHHHRYHHRYHHYHHLYHRAADTFMYPVIKDFGLGGTAPLPDGYNYSASSFFNPGKFQTIRLDGSLFAKFPLGIIIIIIAITIIMIIIIIALIIIIITTLQECIKSKVSSDDTATKIQYNDCKNFHANVGFVFYPGVPSNPGTTIKTVTNGKIFQFGRSAFEAMLADSENGDLVTRYHHHYYYHHHHYHHCRLISSSR